MRVILSGRLCSGKDHVASILGFPRFSFAAPIKLLVDPFCPDKSDKNDRRRLYQQVGQWGRGEMGSDNPLSAERMAITMMARFHGGEITGIDGPWHEFGNNPDFWIELLRAAVKYSENAVVSDCRFPNEIMGLSREFRHVHVMASTEMRMLRAGRSYNPVVDEDVSEQMAISLDNYFAGLGPAPLDPALLSQTVVVWNDQEIPPYYGMNCIDIADLSLAGVPEQ